MLNVRKIGIIAGVLFVIGTLSGVLSVVPVVDDSDFLSKISLHEKQVLSGAFFQFVMAVAYVSIAFAL